MNTKSPSWVILLREKKIEMNEDGNSYVQLRPKKFHLQFLKHKFGKQSWNIFPLIVIAD